MIPTTDMNSGCKRPLLERLVFRGIVFNMSWEDPEMDRQALHVGPNDTVVSITSAGCNPLNLLCQRPKHLICVDGNPAQNAVLELKLAAIDQLDYEAFFDIFAARNPARVKPYYRNTLRPAMSPRAQAFWDKNLKLVAGGLYNYGRTGLFFRVLRAYLKSLRLTPKQIETFFACKTLQEQQALYHALVAPRLWGPASRAFVSFRPLMYLAGVHPTQFDLVDGRHSMFDYVKERIEHVLTRVPVGDNYFLSQAVTGRFRENAVPPYLRRENFEILRDLLDRIQIVNGWLGPYLDTLPAESVNKFNLLDIFDWMSPEAFEDTMRSVLRAAAPNARLIYRSGSYRFDPPATIQPHVHHHAELSRKLLAIDRSATYGSFYVFSVTKNRPTAQTNPRCKSRSA